MADRELVAHLLRRATFGPTAAEVDRPPQRAGFDATVASAARTRRRDAGRAATPVPTLGVDAYAGVARSPSREDEAEGPAGRAGPDRRGTSGGGWTGWRRPTHQLTEKMVFFWHGHWATSVQKVKSAPLMLGQLDTFRDLGPRRLRRVREGDAARPGADRLAGRAAQHPQGAQREPGPRADGAVHARHRRLHRGRRQGRRPGADRLDRRPRHRRVPIWSPAGTTTGEKTILGQTGRFDADGSPTCWSPSRRTPRSWPAGSGSGSPPASRSRPRTEARLVGRLPAAAAT